MSDIEKLTVAELIARYPKTLEVFEEYGVHFCAGCFITLTENVQKAAGHHAVEDTGHLLADLKKAVSGRGHS
jgi:iron-sulfur cluster repair protein YtfE (RIC family)